MAQKFKKVLFANRLALILLSATVLTVASLGYGKVRADQYDDQIKALQNQNSGLQAQSDSLASTATSYQDAINQLATEINGLQQNIVSTQSKVDDLKTQITQAQAQIDQEKKTLGEDIKAMYLEGQMSTLEVLASSQNLSDFVNKQEYRNAVQDKVKTTVDTITALKVQLVKQQNDLSIQLKSLQAQQSDLYNKQSQENSMLAYTEGQIAAYNQQISANNSQIASLRAQQIAANRRLVGSGNVSIVSTGNCGGGYPGDALGPYGHWGCDYSQDNTIDNWGMLNRECVSYTAWRVSQAYGNMPYWGGEGNADQWPGDAASYNIPTGSTPKVGSVAIGTNPYYFGPVGHAMWVEAVSGSQILVSQYNFSAPGQYSTMWISSSLINTFIYFGG
ncbi:MAG TPA: CHAP domain-containing protein [Candidatus Saccharimonadales bacterium]|nr:CHAP domain-containing protein [Candidatus Saccharimonadales bacterium]